MLGEVCPTDREKRTWRELFLQIWERHDAKAARIKNGWEEGAWEKNSPEERVSLSRKAANAIRDIYGLPHLEEEPEKDDSPNLEPGKQHAE